MEQFSYEIDSGISLSEIEEYFENICEKKEGKHKYLGKGWVVELVPEEPRTLGKISRPRTRIIFSGDKEICEELIKNYRKKFLRVGG
ncbi:hypothetical protein [Carboxydothermus ferrireducens]|uniref:RAB protein geranylgeranyltransferase component A n=1 Tax=Carboxydothermus ferrireducens DSM 11255 TaxID=1119529 RepID=A0ABX2RA56_9THEO|nr:hypothetical protein [Carboxydothermus ferrireducens]NYE56742.1 RAB protein geranylgeranyltransferase component A [Carboxydothermus ferrireducens DSM 11255]